MDDQARTDIAVIKTDISTIKVDLQAHMLRTKLLEEQVEPMRNIMISMHSFYRLLKVIAVLAAIAEGFRLIR